MDHHHHQQQLLQQQLLQAQHQQQHLRPVQVPQQPHHHPYNTYQQPYYPPCFPYPQQQQHAFNQSNYTNVYPQQPYPQPLPQSAVVQPLPVQLAVNPAAAAAAAVLSSLVQYSGAVGSQWTTPMVGQPPYRGIGEVGGELFRGHQGNFGYSHLRSVGGAHPSFVGGSHGQGRGGSWPLLSEHGVPSTSSRPVPLVAVDSGAKTKQAGVSFHPPHQTDQAPVTLTPWKSESAPTLKTEVSNYQKPHIAQTPPVALNPQIAQKPPVAQKTAVAWCEICNASCANVDVLKQHQNGRRHQRNLRKIEEVKNGFGTGAKLQGRQRHTSNTKLEVSHQTHSAQDGEEKTTTKNIPSEAVGHENSTETEKQTKNPGQSEMPLGDGSNNVKHSKKRKKMRTPKQPVEPSRRKVVIPIVCDLCNVKCETQEVFDRHLSGKKHFAKYKRFKGHEALYGPVGLQVLYPPNPMAETIFQRQEGRYMPPHVYQDIPVETSSDPQFQQNPTSQGSESIPGCGSSSAVTTALETNFTTEPEISQEATIEAHHLNGISETAKGSNPLSQDSNLEPDKVIPVPQ